MKMKIGFYGSGNMAQSIIQGLLEKEIYPKEAIVVYNRRYAPTLQKTVETYGVTPLLDQKEFFESVDTIILAVKPQVLRTLYTDLQPLLRPNHCLVSLAAGITLTELETKLGEQAYIRAMPNTPLAILEGSRLIQSNWSCQRVARIVI